MRRLLIAPLLAAAAFAAATPADAACTTGRTGVCYQTPRCVHGDCHLGYVDPYCYQGHPATLHCNVVENLYLDPDAVLGGGIG